MFHTVQNLHELIYGVCPEPWVFQVVSQRVGKGPVPSTTALGLGLWLRFLTGVFIVLES